jgi:ABC-type dipeptide/oligopeptide/nickel transport system ATPase component
MATLLEVRDLKTYFFTQAGVVKAVDGVSYDLEEGEILSLVGESGCGKSVSALSIMRLIPDPPGKTVDGEVIFDGQDLLNGAAQRYVHLAPWLAVFPGLAIAIVVFAWNLLGDALRDVLDPRLRGTE